MKKAGYLLVIVALVSLIVGLFGCAQQVPAPTPTPVPTPAPEQKEQYPLHDPLVRFKIATTTSLYDTGLWYYLEPIFEK